MYKVVRALARVITPAQLVMAMLAVEVIQRCKPKLVGNAQLTKLVAPVRVGELSIALPAF
jgi:hypothetical protein